MRSNDKSESAPSNTHVHENAAANRSKSQTNYYRTDNFRSLKDLSKHSNSEWYYNDHDLPPGADEGVEKNMQDSQAEDEDRSWLQHRLLSHSQMMNSRMGTSPSLHDNSQ